jgi:hypothetical protein
VSMGDPEVLRTGEATTAYHADLKVRQVIDTALRRFPNRDDPIKGRY